MQGNTARIVTISLMAQPNPANVNDPFAWRLALTYAAFFGTTGWHLPFFPVWLAARGLDPAAIGVVLAAFQLARIVATPAGTRLADRYGSLSRAAVIAAVATVGAMALLGALRGFPLVLAGVILLSLVSAPLLPLLDAYALKGLGLRGRNFGPVRLWGSVAFIGANLAGGFLFNLIAPSNLIWLIWAGNCAVALATFALVPLPREEAPQRAAAGHSHLRRPAFLAIAAAASLIQASHAVYYGFATLDWTARGFTGVTIGILWALGIIGEIVLFAFGARMPAAIGPVTLIVVGAIGAILRWSLAALNPSVGVMVLLQLLHGASFGATFLGTMMFLSRNAPEGGRAAAQGDIATANSLMMAAASALAGTLYGVSAGMAYTAMAVLAGAGLGCALLAKVFPPPARA
jgi:PPP family 3-phenylpropionic acid transporter